MEKVTSVLRVIRQLVRWLNALLPSMSLAILSSMPFGVIHYRYLLEVW